MAGFDVGTLTGNIKINFGSVREAEQSVKSLQGTFSSYQKSSQKAAGSEKARIRALAQVEKNLGNLARTQKNQVNATSASNTALTNAKTAAEEYRRTVVRFGAGSVEATRAQVQMQGAVDKANKSVKDATANAKAQLAAKKEESKRTVDSAKKIATSNKLRLSTEKELARQSAANDKAVRAAQQAEQAKNKTTKKTSQTNQKATKDTKAYSLATQDVTKSVQLALGPLSGVASRVTALTALFNTNAASIATAVGALTGFLVAMQKSITVGTQLETQLLQTQVLIEATGNSARFTSEQLNQMAIDFGIATMSSAQEARKAQNILLTFGVSSEQAFDDTLKAAQGLSRAMGGDLASNTRRIGRLLEAPIDNLTSLRRAGVQFTNSQEDVIEKLVITGNLAEAQEMILGELAPFIRLATEETQGLAGALDTAGEKFRGFFEESSLSAGAVDSLTVVVNNFNDELDNLLENERVIESLGAAFSTLGQIAGGAIILIVRNLELLVAAMGAAGLVGVAKLATSAMAVFANMLAVRAAGSATVLNVALLRTSNLLSRLVFLLTRTPIGAALTISAAVGGWLYFNRTADETEKKIEKAKSRTDEFVKALRAVGEVDLAQEVKVDSATLTSMIRTRAAIEEEISNIRMTQRGGGTLGEEGLENLRLWQERLSKANNLIAELEDNIESSNDRLKEQQEFLAAWEEPVKFLQEMRDGLDDTASEQAEFNSEMELANGILQKFKDASGSTLKKVEKDLKMSRQEARRLVTQFAELNDPRLATFRDVRDNLEKLEDNIKSVMVAFKSEVDQDIASMLVGADPESLKRLADDLGTFDASIESIATTIQSKEQTLSNLEAFFDFQIGDPSSKIQELNKEFDKIEAGARTRFDGDVPPEVKARIDSEKELQRQLLMNQASEVATTPFTDLDRLDAELLERKARLQDYFKVESEEYKNHINDLDNQADKSRAFLKFADGANVAADVVTGAMEVMSKANKEQTKEFQMLALAQAAISQALAIAKVWNSDANFYVKIAQSAIAGAAVGAQIAQIQGTSFATGGMVRGPGTGTSDSIPANLSNGEFVMRAEAVQRIGSAQLNAMNQGRMSNFAAGGMVGSSGGSGSNTSVIVNDNRSGGAPVEARETTDQFGNKRIEMTIEDVVKQGFARGTFDRDMRGNFGINRPGRRV